MRAIEATVEHEVVRESKNIGRRLAASQAGSPAALLADGSNHSKLSDWWRRAPDVARWIEQLRHGVRRGTSGLRRLGRDYFLDIFSGVGHVATYARAVGLTAAEFEIRYAEQGDFFARQCRRSFMGR